MNPITNEKGITFVPVHIVRGQVEFDGLRFDVPQFALIGKNATGKSFAYIAADRFCEWHAILDDGGQRGINVNPARY